MAPDGYTRTDLLNGEMRIVAPGGVDQVLPIPEIPYFVIHLSSNNNVYALSTIQDIGEPFSLWEVVQS